MASRTRCGLAAMLAMAAGIAAAGPARGQDGPMTFTMGRWAGGEPAIYAVGGFVDDTPARLEQFLAASRVGANTLVVLKSLGGSVDAGLRVGEIIRARRLWTAVGSQTPDARMANPPYTPSIGFYPGYCISACTMAFLGGVRRDVGLASVYAVHQMSLSCGGAGQRPCPSWDQALATSQVTSARIIAYVQAMGVDPGYFVEMAKAGPETVNALTLEQMRRYRIVHVPREAKWELTTTSNGEIFLEHTETTEWKRNQVLFHCRRANGPALFMIVGYDTRTKDGREDGRRILAMTQQGLRLSASATGTSTTSDIVLAPGEIYEPPRVLDSGSVMVIVALSPRLLNALASARSASVQTVARDARGFGFVLGDFAVDRAKLDGFVRSCR